MTPLVPTESVLSVSIYRLLLSMYVCMTAWLHMHVSACKYVCVCVCVRACVPRLSAASDVETCEVRRNSGGQDWRGTVERGRCITPQDDNLVSYFNSSRYLHDDHVGVDGQHEPSIPTHDNVCES